VVLRAARYRDETERVEFGELHIFCGPNFILTVRHSESPDLSAVRTRMENDPDLLRLGTEAVLYAILDAVVDGYARWWPACRTTSTRSKPKCSVAIPEFRVASTN